MRRTCDGFDHACTQPAPFLVRSCTHRDEWHACEVCARDAIMFTGAEVTDAAGNVQALCVEHADHLICSAVAA